VNEAQQRRCICTAAVKRCRHRRAAPARCSHAHS
jgi:hypothetical protein